MEGVDILDRSHCEFILMFNKTTGSDKIHYFMIDPRTSDKMFPKLNTTVFPKLRNLVGYKPVVVDGFLYIIGGKDWESGEYTGATWRYNADTNKWLARAEMTEPRCRFTADVLKGKIYVTGGEIREGKVTDLVEVYDPQTDEWTSIPSLPRPRADHASCVTRNRLYVSGGISNLKHQCSNVFWVYDPLTDEWTEPCPGLVLPHDREKHLMFSVKGEIYVMSGRGFDQDIFQEKEETKVCSYSTSYDGAIKRPNIWDNEHPTMFNPRSQAAAIQLGKHHVYLLGGKSFQKDREIMEVDFYNLKTRKWRTAFPLPAGHSYANVDCVRLTIPMTNKEFLFTDLLLYDKWIMW